MEKRFVKIAIILPISVGLILSLVFFLYVFVSTDSFVPISKNTVISYYDTKADTEDVVDKTKVSELEADDCIGYLRSNSTSPILFNCSYSNLESALSFVPGSAVFGDIGYVYIYTSSRNLSNISKSEPLEVKSIFGENKYRFVEEKMFQDEYGAMTYAPDTDRALIIYAHPDGQVGISSKYRALVFEEVAV